MTTQIGNGVFTKVNNFVHFIQVDPVTANSSTEQRIRTSVVDDVFKDEEVIKTKLYFGHIFRKNLNFEEIVFTKFIPLVN